MVLLDGNLGSEENTGSLLTPERSRPGSEAQQPRNWISQSSQTKKAPPAGHVMPKTSTGLYIMVGNVHLVDQWLGGFVAHPRPEWASCVDWKEVWRQQALRKRKVSVDKSSDPRRGRLTSSVRGGKEGSKQFQIDRIQPRKVSRYLCCLCYPQSNQMISKFPRADLDFAALE